MTPDEAIILPPATVYARPDPASFDWIEIRSAVQVKVLRRVEGFTQISYTEHNQVSEPQFISMQITGWVPEEYLAQIRMRHFFHMEYNITTETSWKVFSDHHTFNIFWASYDDLPSIIPPQDEWLSYLARVFKSPE